MATPECACLARAKNRRIVICPTTHEVLHVDKAISIATDNVHRTTEGGHTQSASLYELRPVNWNGKKVVRRLGRKRRQGRKVARASRADYGRSNPFQQIPPAQNRSGSLAAVLRRDACAVRPLGVRRAGALRTDRLLCFCGRCGRLVASADEGSRLSGRGMFKSVARGAGFEPSQLVSGEAEIFFGTAGANAIGRGTILGCILGDFDAGTSGSRGRRNARLRLPVSSLPQ